MANYRYEAINDFGEKSEDIIEAENAKDVIRKVLLLKKYPVRIEELSKQSLTHYQRINLMKSLLRGSPDAEAKNVQQPKIRINYSRLVSIIVIMSVILFWLSVLTIYIINQ